MHTVLADKYMHTSYVYNQNAIRAMASPLRERFNHTVKPMVPKHSSLKSNDTVWSFVFNTNILPKYNKGYIDIIKLLSQIENFLFWHWFKN